MAAQSFYHESRYDKGLDIIRKLLRDHPNFEAMEEVWVYAARGYAETGKWSEIGPLYQRFVKDRPGSPHRPHMDLYAALAALHLGQPDDGVARLKNIAQSDTYQDVKADACYYLGTHFRDQQPPKYNAALEQFEKSVALYPREGSCLDAAKCAIELRNWEKAKALLQRTIRDFPAGDRKAIEEAKQLLPDVLKRAAKQ
jgi:tetratricopeptide (TPR) repeat protein